MKFSYFPGCTLKTKGAQLDTCGRKAAEALGFELYELPEWQCCGAVYPQATDEIATRLSSVRALAAADAAGQELVTLCSACHHVIKRVNGDMQRNDDIRMKVNNYLQLDVPYEGQTTVLHYLDLQKRADGGQRREQRGEHKLFGTHGNPSYCKLIDFIRGLQYHRSIEKARIILQ